MPTICALSKNAQALYASEAHCWCWKTNLFQLLLIWRELYKSLMMDCLNLSAGMVFRLFTKAISLFYLFNASFTSFSCISSSFKIAVFFSNCSTRRLQACPPCLFQNPSGSLPIIRLDGLFRQFSARFQVLPAPLQVLFGDVLNQVSY